MSVDQIPMGGAQSSACYLARNLVTAGHEVFLITAVSAAGQYAGVTSLSWKTTGSAELRALKLDVLVCVLSPRLGVQLRHLLGPAVRLVLWTGHAHDQPDVQALLDPNVRGIFDGFAFVSEWQRGHFLRAFGLNPSRTAVLRNAIAPAFANLFPQNAPILSFKASLPIIAYTSTPFRGLELLLDAFPAIRAAVPEIRLQVFSSMSVYRVTPAEDRALHGTLYQRCRQMEGVDYIGSLAQPELAPLLRRVTVLSYPNIFAETSCIAVMEAMASGYRIVTSQLGALPETTGGFGCLVPIDDDRGAYLSRFADQVVRSLRADRNTAEAELRRQVDKVTSQDTWVVRAGEWSQWLPGLPVNSSRVEQPVSIGQLLAAATGHCRSGRPRDAEQLCLQILSRQPGHAEALHLLGVLAAQAGKYNIALDKFHDALLNKPRFPEAYNSMGNALRESGQLDLAIEAFGKAVALRPVFPEAFNNLGNALKDFGRMEEAIAAYRESIRLKPSFAKAHFNLANALHASGQLDLAEAAYRQSIVLDPDFAEAHSNLANVLRDNGRLHDAINACRKAIAVNPNYVDGHSNLVFSLLHDQRFDALAISRELRRWNQQHAEPLKRFIKPHRNDGSPDHRLRIGYVSADFSSHVVGRNITPLFANHDKTRFEVFAYSQARHPDALTRQLCEYADHWRNIVGMSDAHLADQIDRDQIDILVDLALHTAGNRLLVFARKPAPIQVTFAGYPGSTGLTAIDYRLSDPYLDPSGMDESVYSEQTVRLPNSFWCFDPLEDRDIVVNSLPAGREQVFTFGSLNNPAKVNQEVLSLWAQVLARVQPSRLLLLAPDSSYRQHTAELFSKQDVDPRRVEFVTRQPRRQYLEQYHSIDLALDTFPYNGHTTSLESIWMGVPVVTLVGQTALSRAGWCQLSNLRLTELAAHTPEQFVQIAVELAGDLKILTELRATLRSRMEASPLMDARKFARGIEACYRQMWRNWCSARATPV